MLVWRLSEKLEIEHGTAVYELVIFATTPSGEPIFHYLGLFSYIVSSISSTVLESVETIMEINFHC